MAGDHREVRSALRGTRTALRTIIRLGLFFIITLTGVWFGYAGVVVATDPSISSGQRAWGAVAGWLGALCCLLMVVIAADVTVLGGAVGRRLRLWSLHVAVWMAGAGSLAAALVAGGALSGQNVAFTLLPPAIAFLLLTSMAKGFLTEPDREGRSPGPSDRSSAAQRARQRKGGRKRSR